MRRGERSPLGLYTIGVAALFLAGFFLLVVLGARSYRGTVAGQDDNRQTRALLSYIATTAKANDTAGAVSVAETEYGTALIIADGDTGFALRIYRSGGQLREDYARADAPLQPDSAQVIGRTEVFTVEQTPAGLLEVTTDAGRVLLRMRSEEGGRP